MNKLRVSYTMLAAAEKGLWQEVSDMLFKVQRPVTKAMEEGREIHKEIEDYITKYNMFPEWLFQGAILLPKTEEKVVVEFNDQFDVSGVFDCVDEADHTLYEFKTGTQNSVDWSRTHQIPMYFMLLEHLKRPVEKAILIHWNQHTKKKDWVVIHNSPAQIEKAKNYVETYGGEILAHLQREGLFPSSS
jgi:hypothetical protein